MSVSSAVSAGHFAPDSPEAASYAATQAYESIKSQSRALVQGDEDISFPSMPRILDDQPSLLKSPSNGEGAPSARIRVEVIVVLHNLLGRRPLDQMNQL
jgi:hypothetical protein